MKDENEKGPLTWLKQLFQETSSRKDESKKPSKYHYLFIVFIVGISILLVSNFLQTTPSNTSDEAVSTLQNEGGTKEDMQAFSTKQEGQSQSMEDFERAYETQIKEALDQIVGVSDSKVLVTVESTVEKVYEKNTVTQKQITNEVDRQGGKRTIEDYSEDEQLVIVRNGEKEVPLVRQMEKPTVRGVLVVARGAENIQVKQWIIEAVTRVLDVPIHKVAVMPKKSKGDS